jgi:O-antigen/teichoic acid export membrane protein
VRVKSPVIRNFLWLGCAVGGSLVTSLVYGVLAARYLGPVDFGRFSLVVGVGALMANVAQGAGASVLTILAAQQFRSAGELLLPGLVTQALIGVVCLALSVPLVLLLGSDRTLFVPAVVYCAGSACLLVYSAPIAIFRGLNQMQWGIAPVIAGLFTVVGVWFAVRRGTTLDEVVAANAVSQIAVLLRIDFCASPAARAETVVYSRPCHFNGTTQDHRLVWRDHISGSPLEDGPCHGSAPRRCSLTGYIYGGREAD